MPRLSLSNPSQLIRPSNVQLRKDRNLSTTPMPLGWRQNSMCISTLAQQQSYYQHKARISDATTQPVESVSWFKLLKFAKPIEIFYIVMGIIMALINGLFVPLGITVYGEFTALLIDRTVMNGTSSHVFILPYFGGGKVLSNASPEENRDTLKKDSVAYGVACLVFSVIQFIAAAISVDLFNYAALRQVNRIKEKFLIAVLRQDQTWYDLNTDVNFATKVSDDIEKYREGIAEKIPMMIYLIASFGWAVLICFFLGAELTLVVLSCTPVIVIVTAAVAKMQSSLTSQELKMYGVAGVAAEEILSSIRTVVAFGGEKIELARYSERLKPAKQLGGKRGLYSGIGSGLMWLFIYVTYAIAFWWGVGLILKHRHYENPVYTPAILMIVFFSLLEGAQNLGLTAPHLETLSNARGSGASILNIMNRIPCIDSFSTSGDRPPIVGDMEFCEVYFKYPARQDVVVLNGLNLRIERNETVALVGPSGSGKSTVLQLIQRMYDPISGDVYNSGHNLKRINVRHLREHIAVVGQEPVLFAGSILENIRMSNPACLDTEVYYAAQQAYCHGFIKKLPEGYNTMIGERGAQLSGGQKQRIAIARALVRKPKILILDEATSALDSHSESVVQKALDAASHGRTTVMVSHRLATVLNADRIVFLDKGRVVEEGTHAELITKKGRYYQLVLENEPNIAKASAINVVKAPTKAEGLRIVEPKKAVSVPKAEKPRESSESDSEDDLQVKSIIGLSREEETEPYIPSTWEIFALCKNEKKIMIIGVVAAFVVGLSFPLFAVLFGEIFGLFESLDEVWVRKECLWFSFLFVLLGVMTGLAIFFQIYLFNVAGVALTERLRIAAYEAMLKQEIGWFDNPVNGVGALSARLATDAASVEGATGTRIGALMQAFATVSIGLVLSLYYSWKMTLVSSVSLPMVVFAVLLEGRVLSEGLHSVRQANEKATTVATEAISNIKTVCAFCGEQAVIKRYSAANAETQVQARKNLRWRGCVFGFGQTAPIIGYALALWYGGCLVADQEIHYKEVIKVSEALMFGSWMLGQALAFAPNFGAAIAAAGRIMTLLRREPLIQSTKSPSVTEDYVAEGKINYKNVQFRYPTRREMKILNGLHLDIPSGKRVALVGPSGCGKSTLIQLLQRLYDPDKGNVFLDEHNIITDMRLTTLRHNLGIVSQEPVLFDRSIRENIAYGDNLREVSIEEIVRAAKEANVHQFISALPEGYETHIGARASQLSGGQKQRIAIARALVRHPRVLLLDEATSALDTHSEKVVQEALDKASEGRTCLIIAHRLATIMNANMIAVINEGKVEELGTHEELLKLKGIYAKLYELQGGILPMKEGESTLEVKFEGEGAS